MFENLRDLRDDLEVFLGREDDNDEVSLTAGGSGCWV
jgi:hypothetical protein